jgi:hypothetical protein
VSRGVAEANVREPGASATVLRSDKSAPEKVSDPAGTPISPVPPSVAGRPVRTRLCVVIRTALASRSCALPTATEELDGFTFVANLTAPATPATDTDAALGETRAAAAICGVADANASDVALGCSVDFSAAETPLIDSPVAVAGSLVRTAAAEPEIDSPAVLGEIRTAVRRAGV